MKPWENVGPGNARTDVGVTDATPSSSLLHSPSTGVLTYEPYDALKAKPFSMTTDSRIQWWQAVFKSLLLPALGMGVMLFAGGIAVSSAGKGTLRAERPSLPSSPLLSAPSDSPPVALKPAQREIPVDPGCPGGHERADGCARGAFPNGQRSR